MMNRRGNRQTMNQMMKKHIRDQLVMLDVHETRTGVRLHEASYKELKWTYAFELAVREE